MPESSSPAVRAGLDGKPLFVQGIAHLHRAVQVVTLADKNERENEPCQAAQQDGGMVMEHYVRAIRRICSKEPFPQPAANRNHQRGENDEYIAQNPKHANARAFALRARPLSEQQRFPGRNSSRPLVAKRFRSPEVAIDVPAKAREAAEVYYTLPLG